MADTNPNTLIIQTSKLPTILGFIAIGVLLVIIAIGFYAYKQLKDANLKLQTDVVEFKKLTDNLVRSSTKWATKDDLENMMKGLMSKNDYDAIQSDLRKLGAQLSAVGNTVGVIGRKIALLEKSDSIGQENSNIVKCADGKLIDTYEYTKHPQIKLLTDINLAPVAEVKFDASSSTPWSYDIYKRQYQLTTVIGKKDSGQLSLYHQLSYSIPDKDKNKKYQIALTSSDYIQQELKNRMYWFNPRLDINFSAGAKVFGFAPNWPGNPDSTLSLGVDLGISFSSYGETPRDNWFRLWRLGLGYDINRQAAQFSFTPFIFNFGRLIPLMSNMYIGARIGVDSAGGLTVGAGIGPQL